MYVLSTYYMSGTVLLLCIHDSICIIMPILQQAESMEIK
jgi:hypothetical protein